MPKMKSHKGLLKRIRLTSKKKVKFPQHGKRHINSHFTGAQVRKLRGRKKCAKGADMRRLEAMMHMRLTPSDRVRSCKTECCEGTCETTKAVATTATTAAPAKKITKKVAAPKAAAK